MKAVNLTINKITIGEYYAQLDQVNFRVHYNDGNDHVYTEQITVKDPESHVEKWLNSIKKEVKKRHAVLSLEDDPLSGALIVRYTQETDIIHEKMTRFVAQVRERIRSGKLSKLTYWDLEKQVKGMNLKLN